MNEATNEEKRCVPNGYGICATHPVCEYMRAVVREYQVEVAKLKAQMGFSRPRVVCFCGSTRFYPAFQEANFRETMAGKIVLSVGFYPHAQAEMHGEEKGCTPEQKVALDQLHFRKIELADEVLILNVGGYIGQSTRNELEHARKLGKVVRFLESET